MDNPLFTEKLTDTAAALDYTAVHNMLQSCVDFPYTQNHIFSDSVIKLIIAELAYWHSLAERLLKEKIGG
jgi:hypothetical protein